MRALQSAERLQAAVLTDGSVEGESAAATCVSVSGGGGGEALLTVGRVDRLPPWLTVSVVEAMVVVPVDGSVERTAVNSRLPARVSVSVVEEMAVVAVDGSVESAAVDSRLLARVSVSVVEAAVGHCSPCGEWIGCRHVCRCQ